VACKPSRNALPGPEAKHIEFVFASTNQQHEYANQIGVKQVPLAFDHLHTVYHLDVQVGVDAELP
jgi:hypothetical protein